MPKQPCGAAGDRDCHATLAITKKVLINALQAFIHID